MSTRVVFIVAASSLGVLLAGARAQDQAPDAPKQEGEPSPLPSLDDLLGTGSDNPAPPEEEADTTPEVSGAGEDELDRLLSGEQIADEFTSAVRLMGKSAARLRQSRATGLATQRLQEDVLRHLDKLIADAQKRSQSSSSSSSQSTSEQTNTQAQPQPGQQAAPAGDNRTESMPPGATGAAAGPERPGDLASWGHLPAKVREALRQGNGETFSSVYRALTEAYYRALAEEPKP